MFTNNYLNNIKPYLDYAVGMRNDYQNDMKNYTPAYEAAVYSQDYLTLDKINSLVATFMSCNQNDKVYYSNSRPYGVAFGDGNTAPTAEDVRLAGNHLTALTASNVSKEISYTADGEDRLITVVYTINNNTGADITIGEIGLFSAAIAYTSSSQSNSNRYYFPVLLERTALETPITIPADGVGKVTYTIRSSWAAA